MSVRPRHLALLAAVLAALLVALFFRRAHRHEAPAADAVAAARAAAGTPGQPPAAFVPAEVALVRPAAGGRLSGQVTDAAGHGVKGALVCARGSSDQLADDDLGDPICAASRDDGGYELAGLFPAHYELDASAPGHLPGRYREDKRETVVLAPGEHKTGLDLVVRTGGVEVRGRVKDIGAGGVANALVELRSALSGAWQGALVGVRADDRGEFRATVAPGPLEIYAAAPGYTQGYKRGAAPGGFIEVLLTPEAVLVGKVVKQGTGEPVAGARVNCGAVDQTQWLSDRSATSNAEGKFRIERLAPGRYKPSAVTPEGRGKAATSVLLGVGGRSEEIVIELHAAARVSGVVVLADGKSPCPGGWMQLADAKAHAYASGSIEPKGAFDLWGVVPGSYDVDIGCEGQPQLHTDQRLEIGVQGRAGLRFVLPGGQHVSGVVARSEGGGVANAFVTLRTSGGDPRAQQRWAVGETRADGSFDIAGVAPASYTLQVDSADAPPLQEPLTIAVVAGQDLRGLRVVLEATGTLEGKVVDQDGRPVKGAQIHANSDRHEQGGRQSFSRDDGGFTLPGLHEGEYHVVASRNDIALRAPGGHDDDVHGTRVKIRPGSKVLLRLVVERETGTIRGQVLHGGQPVSDAFIDAQRESDSAAASEGDARRTLREGWERQPALTDGEGHFEIADLGAGKYTVRAFRKGGGEAVAEHVVVGSAVTLVISPTGTLQGRITVPGGRAPGSFELTIEDAKEAFSRSERFWWTEGTWKLADLPAGNFRVAATALEGTAEITVPLGEGQNRTGLVLDLIPKAKVRGQVVALDTGKPLPGMFVSVAPASRAQSFFAMDGGGDRRNVTDAEGRFEVEDAPAGKVVLTAFSQDWEATQYRWARGRALLRAGETNEVPPLRTARAQVKAPGRAGDLGFEVKSIVPDPSDPPWVYTVAVVRPDGPAAASGLKAGDVIVSIDGQDVTGPNDYLYYELIEVPRGTTIKLGLARGASASIKAASPL